MSAKRKLDRDRALERGLADDAFDAIDSVEERFRHDEKVSKWLDKHEADTATTGGGSRP